MSEVSLYTHPLALWQALWQALGSGLRGSHESRTGCWQERSHHSASPPPMGFAERVQGIAFGVFVSGGLGFGHQDGKTRPAGYAV